jgi:hypothetical protein
LRPPRIQWPVASNLNPRQPLSGRHVATLAGVRPARPCRAERQGLAHHQGVDTGDEVRQRLQQRLAQQEALLRQLRESLDNNTTNVAAAVAGMAVVGLELAHEALTVAIGELDTVVRELADRTAAKVKDALIEAATSGTVHAALDALAAQTPRLVTGAVMAPVDALATSCLRVLREAESAARWRADPHDAGDRYRTRQGGHLPVGPPYGARSPSGG